MASQNSVPKGMVSPAIFEHLQAKLDEDAQVREELRNIVQIMERQGICQSTASDYLCLLNFPQTRLQCQFFLEPIRYLKQTVSIGP